MATKYIISNSTNYQTYIANLTQRVSDAPTDTILENNTGEIPRYVYNSAGNYTIGFNKLSFNPGRTYITIGSQTSGTTGQYVGAKVITQNDIEIYTLNETLTPTNGILQNTTIEIRVYS
jgi:hypothetical protein